MLLACGTGPAVSNRFLHTHSFVFAGADGSDACWARYSDLLKDQAGREHWNHTGLDLFADLADVITSVFLIGEFESGLSEQLGHQTILRQEGVVGPAAKVNAAQEAEIPGAFRNQCDRIMGNPLRPYRVDPSNLSISNLDREICEQRRL